MHPFDASSLPVDTLDENGPGASHRGFPMYLSADLSVDTLGGWGYSHQAWRGGAALRMDNLL